MPNSKIPNPIKIEIIKLYMQPLIRLKSKFTDFVTAIIANIYIKP